MSLLRVFARLALARIDLTAYNSRNMKALISQPFTWNDVKPEHRSWLQDVTHQIQGRVHAIGSEIVRVGVLLRQVRDKLPRGQFIAWVEEHFAFSVSHAYRLLHVGDAFMSHASQIEKFEPSALYVLADPRVPASAREFAVEQASDGRRVTRRDAIEILDAYRPVALTHAEQRTIEREVRMQEPTPAAAASDAELGRLLREAVEQFGMIHFSRAEDDDGDESDSRAKPLRVSDRQTVAEMFRKELRKGGVSRSNIKFGD